MKPFYIYFVINKLTGKYYIGKSQDVPLRWKAHKNCAKNSSKDVFKSSYFYRAIRKYGSENFEIRILFTCYDEHTLNSAEIFFIALFNSTNWKIGYNSTHGGTGGRQTEEVRRKIGINTATRRPEVREKMSLVQIGKKLSPETKAKISLANKGRKKSPRTPEHKEAQRIAHLGKRPSAESNEKNRQSNLGRKVSEETKARMRAGWVIRKQKTIEKRILSTEHTSEPL